MAAWFRMYNEVLDDPKVQRLSGEMFKHWVNVLCLAARNGGILPDLESIAFALRLPKKKAYSVLGGLRTAGLLEDGITDEGTVTRPHNWGNRQFLSDVSNERVKRHRERHRNGECNVTGNDDVSANETPPETETESDSEQRSSPHGPPSDDFETFWVAYPEGRKVAKPKCREKFQRLIQSGAATSEDLIAAAHRYREAGYAGSKFVAMPMTWLNQGRWTDEEIPPAGDSVEVRKNEREQRGNGHSEPGAERYRNGFVGSFAARNPGDFGNS